MEETNLTKLTLQIGDRIYSYETPYNDCDITELIEAFNGLLVGATWHPVSVARNMKEWAEEMLPTIDSSYVEEELHIDDVTYDAIADSIENHLRAKYDFVPKD